MSKEIIQSNSENIPSFDEFKKLIDQLGDEPEIPERLAKLHGKIPRIIRIFQNFDPTGLSGAISQYADEIQSEEEQEKTLRAIYNLAIEIWKIKSSQQLKLTKEKFQYLYYIYIRSRTDKYERVNPEFIQTKMKLDQQSTISIGSFLNKNGFIDFNNWHAGIKITHEGINRVESELLNKDIIPVYAKETEIRRIEERSAKRYKAFKGIYELASGDTSKKIPLEELANNIEIDHDLLFRQIFPYLSNEGYIKIRTADTLNITEEGLDKMDSLLHY